MQIVKKQEKAGIICFYLAILIHSIVMCVGYSSAEVPFRGKLLIAAWGLCCFKILTTKYDKAEWIVMAIAGAVGVTCYVSAGEKYLLYVAVLIFAAKSVDMGKVLRCVGISALAAALIVAVLSLFGIGGAIVDTRDYGRGMVESRYCLGFSHANNLHGTVWYLMCLYVYIFRDKIGWKSYTVLTIINIGMYLLTGSRTGVAVAEAVVLAGLMHTYLNKYVWGKMWPYIAGMLAFLATIVITVVSVSVDCYTGYGPVLNKLNSITTGRLSLAYQSAYIGDWRPFMQGGAHVSTVDNGFAAVASDYGYVALIVFVAFIVWLLIKLTVTENGILYAIAVTAILYTFMERSYTINDAYLLSNLLYVAAMITLGEGYERKEHQA